MITIEKEWEERKISETVYVEIWEIIAETVRILKYEIIQTSSNPAIAPFSPHSLSLKPAQKLVRD